MDIDMIVTKHQAFKVISGCDIFYSIPIDPYIVLEYKDANGVLQENKITDPCHPAISLK